MLVDRIRSFASNPAYRFVGLFAVYLGVESILYPMLSKRYFFVIQWMTVATAKIEHWMLRLFTFDASISDNLVYLGSFGVRIIEECTGVFEVIIFVAAVLAFPTSWQKKAIGLGLGIPLLYVFNVVRILVLVLVGRYRPESFEFMHIYFWQATLIVMITSVWLLWIFKVVRHDEEHLPSPA